VIRITGWGIATSLQDAGRPGLAHLGKSRGGAVDAWSLGLANRLVGNEDDVRGVETSGLLAFELRAPAMIAVAGAMVDVAVERGPPVGWGMPAVLPAGATVRLGGARDGLRTYVAVRGGLVHVALTRPPGSPPRDMNELTVGPDPGVPAATEAAAHRPPEGVLRVWPGPRRDWFTADSWARLLSADYVVQQDTNRVGARLAGPVLERARRDELPSEGLVEGAIQVPADGQPIVMLADHPTTGGYPVIAVVDPTELRHAAQAAPGTTLRFRPARSQTTDRGGDRRDVGGSRPDGV
jgi:allophanate hydrolase subunit 2